ncbi:DeoR/GlpR family DNA-binding transcription regulator [Patulibacter sp.]|uniref:DeoR/GlpR family DNA-binding transcription regulator n=1 Tax=Patulibacter sp. TaxID=1912859 RepID=UPI0027266F9A|nr:DeoR/GlpR family DNA-binding transcription regulator [Patulibacter sp.]MDO9408126.1 DeoR/GlpR family DNA-binding transcription regulator [Patulibacter sp.]
MYAEERQQRIVELARAQGRAEVALLAQELGVTAETIRRDLTALERHGVLRRVHGGAIPVDRLRFEPGLATRDAVRQDEKERIARRAVDELRDASTVLLDAGSTTSRLAELLPGDRELTVVTDSIAIASTLSSRPNVNLLLLGGRVRSRTMAAVGDWTTSQLRGLLVDVSFVGTNGVSIARGLTTPDPDEAAVKRAMITAGRHVVLLADHTKVGDDQFARFGDLGDVDVLITDEGLDAGTATELAAAGPRVERA